MDLEFLLLLIIGGGSAVATFVLQIKWKQSPVRSSAIVGVIASVSVLLFPKILSTYLTENIPLVCFGASFIGMVSSKVVSNHFLIGISGVIFTIIYFNTSTYFNGFGGGLGSAACIALLVTLSIPILKKNRRISNGFLLLRRQMRSRMKKKNNK
ncbi:hypothetical protein [Polaribacter sargassicola]|uniref:hypothetical protein n=1 Tax=Polaribacter sargassicola TaxID=2836891 RepID=UPI001F3F5DF7|nr:hypothetical protein [Polaribacter sp. DS7-9]MCG1036979.1 hypothetical protein [Polaribacter sp. DS7-9]